MADESYISQLKNKVEEKLRLNEAHRKEMLVTAAILAFTGLYPYFKKPKEGQRKKKIDPAGVLSLVALAALLFNASKKGSPEILEYRACKLKTPESVCRARYVIASVQNLVPDAWVPLDGYSY